MSTPVKNAFVAPALFAPNKAGLAAFQGLTAHRLDDAATTTTTATEAPPTSTRRAQLNELLGRARARSLDHATAAASATVSLSSAGTKRAAATVESDDGHHDDVAALSAAQASVAQNPVRAMAVALTTMPTKRARVADVHDDVDVDDDDSQSSGDVKKSAVVPPVLPLPPSPSPPPPPTTTAAAAAPSDSFVALNSRPSDTLPPWCRAGSATPSLHEELVGLCELLDPLASEDALRRESVQRLRQIVTGQFGACDVCVFGSLRAGCALPSSDIDVTLVGGQFPDGSIRGRPSALAPLRKLEQLLRASNASYTGQRNRGTGGGNWSGVTSLPHARVPIVKWSDWRTGVDIDISFNMTDGALTSGWVRQRIEAWPCFRPLLLALKTLLKQRGLADPASGGVGSFTLAVMLTAFLNMRPKQYRTVRDRQLNISFDPKAPLSDIDLGRILCEFFHFYGVCFNNMRCTVLESGVGLRTSTEHALYVVNPIDPSKNVAGASFRYDDVHDVFRHCYHMLDSSDRDVLARYPTRLARVIFAADDLVERSVRLAGGTEPRGHQFPFAAAATAAATTATPTPTRSATAPQQSKRTILVSSSEDDNEFVSRDDDDDGTVEIIE